MIDQPAPSEPSDSPPLLSVQNIYTAYGAIAALQGVSLAVPRGSVVALIGANGAGKSTTLNTISGLLPPRQGRILFDGRDITGWRADRVASLGLVQVPEGRQVLAPLTVEENLLLGAYARHSDLPPTWPPSTRASHAWPSAAANWPACCPAASSRCWPSAAP